LGEGERTVIYNIQMTRPKKIDRNTTLILIIVLLSPYLLIETAVTLTSITYMSPDHMKIQYLIGIFLILVCLGLAILIIPFRQADKLTRWVYFLMTAIPAFGLGMMFLGNPMYLFAGLIYMMLILTLMRRYSEIKL
jgi:hypothetical protein